MLQVLPVSGGWAVKESGRHGRCGCPSRSVGMPYSNTDCVPWACAGKGVEQLPEVLPLRGMQREIPGLARLK